MPNFLGIEIGGTKLQLGVGTGDKRPFVDFRRLNVDPAKGAKGILSQIAEAGRELCEKHAVVRAGYGFGGPVNSLTGRTTKSHQIDGWDNVPLVEWTRENLGVTAVLGNDCDVAAFAEATCGAGEGKRNVFYVTVGTGVGGGLVLNGKLHGAGRPAVAEIGHLRPGLDATDSHQTVESMASGWGIVSNAKRFGVELGAPLTGERIADGARRGDALCRRAIDHGCRTLGWGIAQVITLVAPEVIVVGGGVSLMGDDLFFEPLRRYVNEYVFPPLLGSFSIVPAKLGESVVVYGAVALAASME